MEFDEPDFALIDTLFSLAEAHLFMQLIELQDNHPDRLPAGKNCADIYRYSTHADRDALQPGGNAKARRWPWENLLHKPLTLQGCEGSCGPVSPGWQLEARGG